MASNIPGLITTFRAGGAVTKRRLVKHGAADGVVLQGAASADKFVGVSTDLSAANGAPVDVIRTGVAPVEYGGTVARGDALTSDASGKAVVAAPAAGANAQIVGFAEVSGVAGDIGAVFLARGVIQG